MPRRVAVIDIGSNSARMAIFERTSRFGFFILREVKSKVRISEGAYEHQGFLQPEEQVSLRPYRYCNMRKPHAFACGFL